MFYVKQEIGSSVEIIIEINDENVLTICPNCGKEHHVDLAEILRCDDTDLFSTSVFCEECSIERSMNKERINDMEKIYFEMNDTERQLELIRSNLDYATCVFGEGLSGDFGTVPTEKIRSLQNNIANHLLDALTDIEMLLKFVKENNVLQQST